MVISLVDIDGVLNPLGFVDNIGVKFEVLSTGWVNWRLSKELHASMLIELQNSTTALWASSWEEDSVRINNFYDMPAMGVVPLREKPIGSEQTTWKLPSIQNFLLNYPNEPVVWIDDELYEDAYAWSESRGQTLLIKTDPNIGLTPLEFQVISFWVKSRK